ncbi:MAG: NAD-dependent epimerase/dehydratase family protein [Phycisphaerae bacterium]|nr:NAD-dependent epimerase/dehydratase family protein [Phycisphaerae bacterium]
MKVLVTGGTGFVGSHLIEALRAAGDTVRALVRPDSNRNLIASLGAEPAIGSLEDAESLRRACEGCDVVYHAAARVDIVGGYKEFYETTVAGTERLIDAANTARVPRFVYVSSCGIYHPKLLRTGVINEDTPTPPPPSWFVYGRTKLAAENAVRRGIRPEPRWTIVRLGYVYGPRNRVMHRYLRPLMTRQPLMLVGDGNNEMAMVYVTDAVRAIVAAGHSSEAAGRALIVVGQERVTQREYLGALADGFGVPRPTRTIPYRLAFGLAWLGEFLPRFNSELVILNRSAVALTGLPQRIDGEKSRELLKWRPQVRFADGVREAFDWYYREYAESVLSPAPSPSQS